MEFGDSAESEPLAKLWRPCKRSTTAKARLYVNLSPENEKQAEKELRFYLPDYMIEELNIHIDENNNLMTEYIRSDMVKRKPISEPMLSRVPTRLVNPVDGFLGRGKGSPPPKPQYSYTPSFSYSFLNTHDYSNLNGVYNPRFHLPVAQQAGFTFDDGQPRILYVGNLDLSVNENLIATLFNQIGRISKIKVFYDAVSRPFAFVEFTESQAATRACLAMNKRMLLDREMKVNLVALPPIILPVPLQQPSHQYRADTSRHFYVFVGDLPPEIDSKTLKDVFLPYGEVTDAKVIRDSKTLKSRGYGFVSYQEYEEAKNAIEQMNGRWLGRHTIRTNWATRKPTEVPSADYRGPTRMVFTRDCTTSSSNVSSNNNLIPFFDRHA